MKYVCIACKTSKNEKQNASRLADHLWQCPLVEDHVKKKLLEDSVHIRSVVKRYSGESRGVADYSSDDLHLTKKRRLESKSLGHIEECSEKEGNEISMKRRHSFSTQCSRDIPGWEQLSTSESLNG